MQTFNEFIQLQEVFDQPYPFSISKEDSLSLVYPKSVYLFTTDSGSKGEIYITYYEYAATIYFRIDDSIEITNKGDAFRIMATVISVFKDYHKKHKEYVKSYKFSAEYSIKGRGSETSRIDLYRAIVKRYAKDIGWKFKEEYNVGEVIFIVYQ